ncbi:MAG: transporter, partial [candidate division NC10 bacterium]|nr:transporter [candidate division NC10 bacterium]
MVRMLAGVKWIVITSLIMVLLVGKVEAGGPLSDTIRNLFGPDGIILKDVTLKKAPPDNLSRAGDFQASSQRGLEQLNDEITSTFGVFSFNSSVTGFSFDLERGVPIRTTESLGPLLTERAPTLGARRLDLNLTYTRIDFTKFQGTSLRNVQLAFLSQDINENGAIDTKGTFKAESDQVRVRLNLGISEDILAIIATYGLTSYWDIGVVIPVVHLRFRADGEAVIVDKNGNIGGTKVEGQFVHLFRNGTSSITASSGGDATGLGDVILRTKYNLLKNHPVFPDLAAVAEVKLPTGNDDDLLGTGGTNVTSLLVASRTYGGWFTPHLNLGYVAD